MVQSHNREFDFDWVDAFSQKPFCGNGCAVFYDDGILSDQSCLNIVRETSLVECTFLSSSDIADFRVRYFLSDKEIPFAGHPTIATAMSLISRGKHDNNNLVFETSAGLIHVEVSWSGDQIKISMTQPAPRFGPKIDKKILSKIGGIPEDSILCEPQVVSTGLPFPIVVVDSLETLKKVKIDFLALDKLRSTISENNLMEPFWVCLTPPRENGLTFSRLLLQSSGRSEDPFTGSATGAMAAYLWENKLIQTPTFNAHQGDFLGRPGEAEVEVLSSSGNITGVKVTGSAYVLMTGKLKI
jgi:trans-2,3-dihydro-3-hydroxyanthranilate isomerase